MFAVPGYDLLAHPVLRDALEPRRRLQVMTRSWRPPVVCECALPSLVSDARGTMERPSVLSSQLLRGRVRATSEAAV